jgi:hypothetical protein
MPSVKIDTVDGKLAVTTPYDGDFVRRARKLGGKWDGKAWLFMLPIRAQVEEALSDCYGYSVDRTEDRLTLRVTVHVDLHGSDGPVKFGPYTLARAWGRDSGARPGEDVALIEGRIRSGGSRKNWGAHVDAGSVFIIGNVPLTVAEKLRDLAVEDTYRSGWEPQSEIHAPVESAEPFSDGWGFGSDGLPSIQWERQWIDPKNRARGYRWLKPVYSPSYTIEEV